MEIVPEILLKYNLCWIYEKFTILEKNEYTMDIFGRYDLDI